MANSSREGESGQRHALSALRKASLEGVMAPGIAWWEANLLSPSA
jgi:hypothetical protein